MEAFYVPGIPLGDHRLPEAEARHCVSVLRHKPGDQIEAVDGRGGRYQLVLRQADRKGVAFDLLLQVQESADPDPALHILCAPTKNSNRFEWFLEKATELGVSSITPVYTRRSERRSSQDARWERVLVAAMKQSRRSWLPELRSPMGFDEALTAFPQGQRFIAHCGESPRQALWEQTQILSSAAVLIGPEGDFDQDEVQMAAQAGWLSVHLGKSRLRTETAAVAAVHWFQIVRDQQEQKKMNAGS